MDVEGSIGAQGVRQMRSLLPRGAWLHVLVLTLVAGTLLPPAVAADFGQSYPVLEFSAGAFGILDGADDSFRVGAEYRFRPRGPLRLSPGVGISVAGDGSNYVYGDVRRDFWIDPHWVVHVSFGAGRFHDGDVLQLGGELEFQSSLGLARRFDNGWRAGVLVQHLSNGGLFKENPGTEVALFLVGVPIGTRHTGGLSQSASDDSASPVAWEASGDSADVGGVEYGSVSAGAGSAEPAGADSSSLRMSSPASAR